MNESGGMMPRQPLLFIAHGSPMNAIENNDFTRTLSQLSGTISPPEAIVFISSHWLSRGTRVTAGKKPRQMFDFSGYSPALSSIRYRPPGSPSHAQQVALAENITLDYIRGIDHSVWSIARHLFPDAAIPVIEMSLSVNGSCRDHYEIGRSLRFLRDRGILIIGTGNVVHNQRETIQGHDAPPPDWAKGFDDFIAKSLLERRDSDLVHYEQRSSFSSRAMPTNEHFLPLLHILGASYDSENPHILYRGFQNGSISMLSFSIGLETV